MFLGHHWRDILVFPDEQCHPLFPLKYLFHKRERYRSLGEFNYFHFSFLSNTGTLENSHCDPWRILMILSWIPWGNMLISPFILLWFLMSSWWPRTACVLVETGKLSAFPWVSWEIRNSCPPWGTLSTWGNLEGFLVFFGDNWLHFRGCPSVCPGVPPPPSNCYHPGYTRITLSFTVPEQMWRLQWYSQFRSVVFLELSFRSGINQWCFVHKDCKKCNNQKRSNLRYISSLVHVNILLVLLGIHILHDHGPFCADIEAKHSVYVNV